MKAATIYCNITVWSRVGSIFSFQSVDDLHKPKQPWPVQYQGWKNGLKK